MKRKALSVISCLALLLSSLPSTAVFVSAAETTTTSPGDPQYVTINGTDKTKHAVFANGTDIEVTYDAEKGTNTVTWTDAEQAKNKIQSVPTDADVFAGCHGNATSVGTDNPVKITINGAHLNTVYGGGLHESTVGNVEITVKGKAELNWVCGGGANALIHDDCSSGAWESDANTSKTVVNNAVINIEDGAVADAVYGGGQGNSKTDKTTINIKDGTFDSVCASGSNGYTGTADVNIEGGTIKDVRSVTRGTIESSDVAVTGGTIDNLYIGGSDGENITGTVNNSNVDITGGTVKELHAGKSNNTTLDVAQPEYSFSADPSSVDKYNADIETKKDEANAYYYFKAYKADGEEANGSELAKNLTKIVMPMTGSLDNKAYQFAFVMANGETVVATDVKEGDAWKATRLTCKDGSYVDTNYDAIHLFGGRHNDDTLVESTDVTLDGTTHVQTVWGGGWHKSYTGTTKVTVKNNAEVKGIQGGAAALFAGTNCNTAECPANGGKTSCMSKPSGNTKDDYDVPENARVQKAEVIVESCKPYTTPSGALCQTMIYGGGESLAYTGECSVTINGGDFGTDGIVYPAGSNGYTGKSSLVVDGEVTIPKVASAKSGIVKSADIEIKNGTVTELTLGMIESPEGYGELGASDVKVSGDGTVSNVVFGHKNVEDEIKPESDEGYTLTADGGTIEQVAGEDVDYTKQDLVCEHSKYNHTEDVPAKPATCAEDGTYAYYKCGNCGRYIADDTDDHTGKPVDVTNKAGDAVDTDKIVMTAGNTHHVFDNAQVVAKVPATCLTDGKEAYAICTVCKKQIAKATPTAWSDPAQTIPTEYSFENVDSEDDLVINATGHTLVNVPATEATCTKTGLTQGTNCSACGAIIVPQYTVAMKDHTPDPKKVAKVDATCTTPGYTEGTQCSVCKQIYEGHELIPALNHNFEKYTYNNDATCTVDGTKTAKCTRCEVKDTILDPDHPAAHTPEKLDAVDATCTSTGLTEGSKCSVCGAELVKQLATPMIPHTPVTDEGFAATCTKLGLSEGSHCSVCGGVIVAQVVLPVKGHSYKDGVCTVCGATEPTNGNTATTTNPTTITTTTAKPTIPAQVNAVKQAKIKKLTVKSKAKKKITVSWAKVKGAKGYQVEVSKSKSFKKSGKILTKTSKKVKINIKNSKIKSKKTYYVRVRAYATYKNASGATKKVYSSWNKKLRKVKVK